MQLTSGDGLRPGSAQVCFEITGPPMKGGGGMASSLFCKTIELFIKPFVMIVIFSLGPSTFQPASVPMDNVV